MGCIDCHLLQNEIWPIIPASVSLSRLQSLLMLSRYNLQCFETMYLTQYHLHSRLRILRALPVKIASYRGFFISYSFLSLLKPLGFCNAEPISFNF